MRKFQSALIALLALLLVACGGGSSSGGGDFSLPGQSVSISYTLDVFVLDANGQRVSSLTQGDEYQATAKVIEKRTTTSASGGAPRVTTSAAKGVSVAFATEANGGTFTPSSGTALSDSKGIAAVVMTAGGIAGAYTLKADLIGDSGSADGSLDFAIGKTLSPKISLSITDGQGHPVGAIAPGQVVTVNLNAKRVGELADGTPTGELEPAADALLTVSSDAGVFSPTTGMVMTDATGYASVRYKAEVTSGAFIMSASGMIGGVESVGTLAYRISAPPVRISSFFIAQPKLGAGGTTSIHVAVVGSDNKPYTTPLTVAFSSPCADAGTANVTQQTKTINGEAVGTYTAIGGCSGTDTVTAAVSIPGSDLPLTASGTLEIAPASAGSIVFVKSDPSSIALAGRGSIEVPSMTTITFAVQSLSGAPAPGAAVHFTLTTKAGGLSLSRGSATSDSSGEVTVNVTAGTVATVFRVVATLHSNPAVSTQSGQVTVSTAAPDQDAFSVYAETLNPEAWNYDGVEVKIMARAADFFRNPVPDGTRVQFTTSGGSVDPSCEMTNGSCEVVWRSQNPHPAKGRAVILATTNGDESLTDTNGDSVFTSGVDTWKDLPEAWRDDNENGRYDHGEFFLDADGNNAYSSANGRYDGALCVGNLCGSSRSIDVRDSIVLVMATSQLHVSISPSPIYVDATSSKAVTISVSDMNGNLPPEGTTIDIKAGNGQVDVPADLTVGTSNARGAWRTVVTVSGDSDPSTGALVVTATTPKGNISTGQAIIDDTGTTSGGGGCEFSPCPSSLHAALELSSLFANPDKMVLLPGQSLSMPIDIRAYAKTDGPIEVLPGVSVAVRCNTVYGGVSLSNDETTVVTQPTLTYVTINAASSGFGMGRCVFQAGDQTAVLTVTTNDNDSN